MNSVMIIGRLETTSLHESTWIRRRIYATVEIESGSALRTLSVIVEGEAFDVLAGPIPEDPMLALVGRLDVDHEGLSEVVVTQAMWVPTGQADQLRGALSPTLPSREVRAAKPQL